MNDETKEAPRYPVSEYTFPKPTRIKHIDFDEKYMLVMLLDGRLIGIPLSWIPTIFHAPYEQRMQYFLGEEGVTIHWNPDSGINEDLRLADYLTLAS